MPGFKISLAALITVLLCGMRFCLAQGGIEYGGELENSFRNQESKKGDAYSTDISEYLQNYRIGIKGEILSPNFFTYKIRSNLTETQRNTGSAFVKIRNYDLVDLSGNIFSNRPVSMYFFYRRNETDIFSRNKSSIRFGNSGGGNMNLRLRGLPRISMGYRLLSTLGANQEIIRSHQSNISLSRSSQNSRVDFTFRDEQRNSTMFGNLNHTQEFNLSGSTDLFDNRTNLKSKVNYTNHLVFKSLRVNIRGLSRLKNRDRLLTVYSFANFQSPRAETYTNSIEGQFTRFINRQFRFLVDFDAERSFNISNLGTLSENRQQLSGGIDFNKDLTDSTRLVKLNAISNLEVLRYSVNGTGAKFNNSGTVEWKKAMTPNLFLSQSFNLVTNFSYLPNFKDYVISNNYLLEIRFRPLKRVILENRLTISDTKGVTNTRKIEERGSVALFLLYNLVVSSSVTIDIFVQPDYKRYASWINNLRWSLTRSLELTSQSYWNYDESNNVQSFWVETTANYIFRRMNFQFQLINKHQQGRSTRSFFFNAIRTIGRGDIAR